MTIRIPKVVLIALLAVLLIGGGVALGVSLSSDSPDDGTAAPDSEASDTSSEETTSFAEVDAILDAVAVYRRDFDQEGQEMDAGFAVCEANQPAGKDRRDCYDRVASEAHYAEDRILLRFQELAAQVGPRCRAALRERLELGALIIEPQRVVDPCRNEAQ